jgi:hypothetical protein
MFILMQVIGMGIAFTLIRFLYPHNHPESTNV